MYSHGSSARAGVGKRGHGGRNYRPPKERRDPDTTPPPLRQCRCVLEFEIEEYTRPEPQGRDHVILTGGQGANGNGSGNPQNVIKDLERCLRSQFLVHLVIPGRKQTGPVAIYGETYRQALPAAAYLLRHIWMIQYNGNSIESPPPTTESSSTKITLNGRVFANNAQESNPTGLVGIWNYSSSSSSTNQDSNNNDFLAITPYWLFQSPAWSVLTCELQEADSVDNNSNNDDDKDKNDEEKNEKIGTASSAEKYQTSDSSTSTGDASASSSTSSPLERMKICLDNAMFRLGTSRLSQLDFIIHTESNVAICVGPTDQVEALRVEIR